VKIKTTRTMAVVYKHIRLDKNEPFYVGIGKTIKRAYDKRRGDHWKSITNKTDYKVEILFEDISWSEACLKEIELISLYGRKDLGLGTLVNKTNGGDGTLGYIPSKEMNLKRSEKLKGRIFSEEHKNKISNSLKGHKVSDKSIMKLMERNRTPISESTRIKMSNAQKNRYKDHVKKVYVKKGRNHNLKNNPRAKKIMDINTGEVYGCVKDLSNSLGRNYAGFRRTIKKQMERGDCNYVYI
jgi:hypothetical protein